MVVLVEWQTVDSEVSCSNPELNSCSTQLGLNSTPGSTLCWTPGSTGTNSLVVRDGEDPWSVPLIGWKKSSSVESSTWQTMDLTVVNSCVLTVVNSCVLTVVKSCVLIVVNSCVLTVVNSCVLTVVNSCVLTVANSCVLTVVNSCVLAVVTTEQ